MWEDSKKERDSKWYNKLTINNNNNNNLRQRWNHQSHNKWMQQISTEGV